MNGKDKFSAQKIEIKTSVMLYPSLQWGEILSEEKFLFTYEKNVISSISFTKSRENADE